MSLEELRAFVHPDDKIAFERIVARAWAARDARRRYERQWSRDMNQRLVALDASARPKPTSDRMAVGE